MQVIECSGLSEPDILMKRAAVCVLFLCCASRFSASQQLPDTLLDRLILQGIDLTLRQKYGEAESFFRGVAKQFPTHPAGYLYQAAVQQTRAIDYVIPLDTEPFDSLLEIGEKLSERMIDSGTTSAWGYYFLATTNGYDAYARVERGDWFGGFRKGLAAASDFKNCLEIDSNFIDAFAGLGTYYYWRSRKTEFLNWLPFISDDRPEGIRLLKECIRRGIYNRFVAASALLNIYLDGGRYEDASQVAQDALRAYPSNRVFLWGLAESLSRLGKVKETLETYDILLKSIMADSISNPYSEILCHLNIAKIRLRSNDTTGVETHLRTISGFASYAFPEELKTRAATKFVEAKMLQEALNGRKETAR